MSKYPDGNVLLRNLSRDYPTVSHGKGVYLFDTDGKKYYDGSGGAMVNSVGHGNADIARAVGEQLAKVGYVNGTQFTSQPTEELATRLCAIAPKGLDRAFFLSSGSEAIEAAVKFTRQLWVERGQPTRGKFIARSPGYHGNTLFALSASARGHYKKFFGPLLSDVIMIPAPYGYRSAVPDYEKDGAAYYAQTLENAILAAGPENVAGFLFEPVIGSSAGGSLPPPNYFAKVQDICRKYGVLMIADEVLCGAGRTGKFYACEHFGLEPDLLVLGKGLNSGYAAVSAVLTRTSHVNEMKQGSGGFMHAQTYLQAPCMTAVGLAVVNYIEKHGLVANAATNGRYFHDALRREIAPLASVGNVTGIGLLAGVELVKDKTSKEPFSRGAKVAERFVSHAFERGLIVWPNMGQADGTNGDLFMLAPALNVTTAEIDELVGLVKTSLSTFAV